MTDSKNPNHNKNICDARPIYTQKKSALHSLNLHFKKIQETFGNILTNLHNLPPSEQIFTVLVLW